MKNWKEREFRALNKKDNFKIEYFVPDGAKRGEINCCGYRLDDFSKDEAEEQNTQYGIKLVPHNDQRRTWMFKCESEVNSAAICFLSQ